MSKYESYHSDSRELTSMANVNSRSQPVSSQVPSEAWQNLQHCERHLSPKCWIQLMVTSWPSYRIQGMGPGLLELHPEIWAPSAQSASTSEHWNSVTPVPTTVFQTAVKPHEMSAYIHWIVAYPNLGFTAKCQSCMQSSVPHNKMCMQWVLPVIHVNSIVFSNSSAFSVFSQALTIYHSVSKTVIAYRPLLALKNNHRSSYPSLHTYSVWMTGVQHSKFISRNWF